MRKATSLKGKPRLPARWPIKPEDLMLSPQDDDLRRASRTWRAFRSSDGYIQGWVNKKTALLHRLVAERIIGRPIGRGETVDHLNQDKQDNRRENLRVVPMSLNQHNIRQPDRDKKTPGPRCVYPTKNGKRWYVNTTRVIDGKLRAIHVGTYDTIEEAAAAYEEYRKTLPGYVPLEKAS